MTDSERATLYPAPGVASHAEDSRVLKHTMS